MVPCIYGMDTDPNTGNAGHFYLIVGLTLANTTNSGYGIYGASGSIVLVKDVWRCDESDEKCAETLPFSYTDLLTSIWVSTQIEVGVGRESYSALAITK